MFRFSPRMLAFGVLALLPGAALAQSYVETFDGPLKSVMLSGVLEFGVDPPWLVDVVDGNLVLTNATEPKAVRYYSVKNVLYDGVSQPASTEDATIEVAVKVESTEERSGAGVIARFDPRRKTYVLLAIGAKGAWYVAVRDERRLTMTVAKATPLVKVGEMNRIRVRSLGNDLAYDINGEEVLRLPVEEQQGRLVGIAAFGQGTFKFDEVQISPPGAEAPAEDAPDASPEPAPKN